MFKKSYFWKIAFYLLLFSLFSITALAADVTWTTTADFDSGTKTDVWTSNNYTRISSGQFRLQNKDFVGISSLFPSSSTNVSSNGLVLSYDMETTSNLKLYAYSGSALVTRNSNNYFEENGLSQPIYPVLLGPASIYVSPKTYVVWLGSAEIGTANTADPYITFYDHQTGTWSDTVKVGDSPLNNDDHGGGAIVLDSSSKIHVFFGSHSTALKHMVSTNALNISSWTNLSDIGTDVTYPRVIRNSTSNVMYLITREGDSITGQQAYRNSSDDGSTWSAVRNIVDFGASTSIYGSNAVLSQNRIHMAWTFNNATLTKRFNIYHAYLNLSDHSMYCMNGSNLGVTINITEANTNCLVENSGSLEANTPALHLDSSGNPYLIYPLEIAASTYYFRFSYWNGTGWSPPTNITSTDHLYNFGDFIINSANDIEAYVTTAGSSGRGGDIEKWIWNGTTWSQSSVILTQSSSGRALDNPQIVSDFSSDLKLIFAQINVDVYKDNVKDFSTENNIGTNEGGTDTDTGKLGSALDLDGTADYVNISDANSLDLSSYTISFWLNHDYSSNPATNVGILWKSNDTGFNRNYAVYMNTDRTIGMSTCNASSCVSSAGTTPLTKDVWYLITATFNNSEDKQYFYINGTLEDSDNVTLNPITNNQPIEIGRQKPGGAPSRYIDTQIDEVLIFNRSLSSSEVLSLYREGFTSVGSWTSPTFSITSNKKLASITIIHSNLSSNDVIDKVEILQGGSVVETFDDNITSGSQTTLQVNPVTVTDNAALRITIAGNGTSTPIIEEVSVDFSSLSTQTSGLPSNIVTSCVNFTRIVEQVCLDTLLQHRARINFESLVYKDLASINVTPPIGLVYKYFEINKIGIGDIFIDQATIRFSVNKSWLTENGIDKNNIFLQKYVGESISGAFLSVLNGLFRITGFAPLQIGPWLKTDARILSETDDKVKYEVSFDDMSLFAITGDLEAAQQELPIIQFDYTRIAIVAIIVLLIIFSLKTIRKPKRRR